MIPLEGGKAEFVGARKERYKSESRNPAVDSGTLDEDLLRRDFTVNAIAVSLNADRFGRIVDPLDGQADSRSASCEHRATRCATFDDDPLRIMRAIRFVAQLGFDLAEDARPRSRGCASG